MNFESPMAIQKAAHLFMFVRPVVVHDQLQFQIRLKFAIQSAQEFDELLVAVTRITFAAYLTAGYVESSKQGRRSVSDVIVRPGVRPHCVRWLAARKINEKALRSGLESGIMKPAQTARAE
jgi:hypothetical protein